ncbi:methionyl-tRNA formyltransferase [candidate division KSB1 bacterium]
MKVIFLGTPEFAVPSLKYLIEHSNHDVLAVVTTPDKKQGRGRKIIPSPVAITAEEYNLPVFKPDSFDNPDFLSDMRKFDPDIFVVVAFRILPESLFTIPKYGTINLHASLLPKYRGAAPIQWSLINGENKTGVTTFLIDKGIDTGNILLQEETDIQPNETAGELSEKLSDIGSILIDKTLTKLEQREIKPIIQPKDAYSKAPKITQEITKINWNKSASEIVNLIRGLSPVPAAYTVYKDIKLKIFLANISEFDIPDAEPGKIINADSKRGLIIKAKTGSVVILDVQREGKKRMKSTDLLRGMEINKDIILA